MCKVSRWFRCFPKSTSKPTHRPTPEPEISAVAPPQKKHAAAESDGMRSLGKEAHFSRERVQLKAARAHVKEARAAVTIQAYFRSYLARRALRALKSLVKLQALVRGHIIRKQTLHRMHSLLRVQARARAGRSQISDSPSSSAKSSQFCHPGPVTPEKFEHIIRSNSARRDHSPLKRNSSRPTSRMINEQDKQQNNWYWSGHIKRSLENNGYADEENSDKIVRIDTVKSNLMPKRKNLFHSTHLILSSDQYSHSFSTSKDSTTHQTLPSPSMAFPQDLDESPFCTAHNSPQFYSASSRNSKKSLFTPSKSDGADSYLSGYMDHPNYMACTQSSKAKTRSVSAPKQRTHMERSGSVRRYLVYSNYEESKINAQRVNGIRDSFVNKAYPGSGRLDRLGLPVINSGCLNGY